MQCRIRRQKNDPFGEGLLVWIPELPSLGPLCPAKLLRAWLAQRAALRGQGGGVLSCVTGVVALKPASGDSFRRMLSRRVAADAGHEMAHQMGTSTREIEAQVRDDEGPPSPTARAAQ